MNKTQLKEFAVNSRNKLRQDVYSRLKMFGIDESGINEPTLSTNDLVTFPNGFRLESQDARKYNNLKTYLKRISKDKKFKEVLDDFVEEVAYTWFNRIIAIRFMEVNNYMPHSYRVLSSNEEAVLEPEILRNYVYLDIGLTNNDLDKLDDLSLKGDVHSQNKMFELLFLKQCHALNEALPELFEKTEDFKDLLLILSFTDPQSVVYKVVNEVSEASFDINSNDGSGQIEIIGWLYQYYNSERKDEVINVIKKRSIRKEDIPAATQIFTPQWIVKYMVDNSLGKYWIERNPNSSVKDDLEYLIKDNIEYIDDSISPEELTFLDNAMGSGHILVYAFDVFMKIYISEGYQPRRAANLILEKNLFGLDIDKRAYQLAYFALMMKAREHNTRILEQDINLNIEYFEDVNIHPSDLDQFGANFSAKEKEQYTNDILTLVDLFKHATELGSIIIPPALDYYKLDHFIVDSSGKKRLDLEETKKIGNSLLKISRISNMLVKKYHCISTNPPYMGKYHNQLSNYINENYKEYNQDLFSVFIYRNIEMTNYNGYSSFMTPNVWMYLKSYSELRKIILNNYNIDSLIDIRKGSFYSEATVDIITFNIQKNNNIPNSLFIDLKDYERNMEDQNDGFKNIINNQISKNIYKVVLEEFFKIPRYPFSYWISENALELFNNPSISEKFPVRKGMDTGNNAKFLRLLHEVNSRDVFIGSNNFYEKNLKWVPYDKGGSFRKWYGNIDYILKWHNDGKELKSSTANLRSQQLYFKDHITWNAITSSKTSARFSDYGSIFDSAGSSMFPDDLSFYYLGVLNSPVFDYVLKVINPTLNYGSGSVGTFPSINVTSSIITNINKMVEENINISKQDWSTRETSWNFSKNPIIEQNKTLIEESYNATKENVNKLFSCLKFNEEKLNSIYISLYKLNNGLNYIVKDKDITITKIFDHKNDIYDEIKGNRYIKTKEDIIKEFMSYAVGCMMGRYSLDEEGLIYAGGEWDYSRYNKFKPQNDNILIISDESGIENDIVDRFVEFVKVSFGDENLNENLEFIADSLYANGTVRDRIRRYFNNDFYKNHVQMYKKTPIYWLYDTGSGKTKRQQENAFKALIYVHRYDGNTTGNVRINYLHEIQARYEREMSILKSEILNEDLDAKARRDNQNRIDMLERKIKEIKDYDEDIAHIAIENIEIDLDDGIKANHKKVQTDRNGKVYNLLSRI